ncbi:MAG: hypothetical protein QOH42_1502 [Blastocatellia bacterium]|jgi:hypothetical protein|nr:hypothetical protein [Blastocatellia bacterium]
MATSCFSVGLGRDCAANAGVSVNFFFMLGREVSWMVLFPALKK